MFAPDQEIMKTTCASAGGFQSRSALCSTVTGCAGHVQSSPNRAISPVSGWWSITPSAAVQGWGPVAPLLAGGASRRPHRAGRTQHTPSTAAQTPPQFNPQRHAGLTTWSASRSASRSAEVASGRRGGRAGAEAEEGDEPGCEGVEALGVRWPRANPRVAVCFR